MRVKKHDDWLSLYPSFIPAIDILDGTQPREPVALQLVKYTSIIVKFKFGVVSL